MGVVVHMDPDAAARVAVEQTLVKRGYQVASFASAPAGLRFCETQAPRLVILDTHLPVMSGFEAIRHLRSAIDVPVLFVTASQDSATIEETVRLGSYGCLPKPVDPDALHCAVEVALALAERDRRAHQERKALEEALKTCRTTGAAVGMLMERHRLRYMDAFEALRSYARSQRMSVVELAQTLVDNADLINTIKKASGKD